MTTTYYIREPVGAHGICDVYAIDLRVAHAPSHFSENRSLWQHVGYVNALGALCMFQGDLDHEAALHERQPLAGGTTFTF